MQVLPRRVVGLLLDLRPRARAARNPPHSRLVRRRHRLRSPPPDLQDTHEEGIAVHDVSLQGVTLRRSRPETTAMLRALSRGGRLQTNGAKEVGTAPYLFTHLLLGGALRESCRLALWLALSGAGKGIIVNGVRSFDERGPEGSGRLWRRGRVTPRSLRRIAPAGGGRAIRI